MTELAEALHDVGDVLGYADFLEAVIDPKPALHEEWIGDHLNAETFSPVASAQQIHRNLTYGSQSSNVRIVSDTFRHG
ncbi:MAG: hypothetical protein DWQ37_20165 [Planctomycetota bacterium]|nr:MAG: hypothetical protein DWQ37_20165 [Planctomycetota bacterium]